MKYDSDAGLLANYFVINQNGIYICSMQNISQAYLLNIQKVDLHIVHLNTNTGHLTVNYVLRIDWASN